MKQQSVFTTTAMAAALVDTPISYEDLGDLEKEFEDVETEIVKIQAKMMTPLYAKRQELVSQIPNFWPLVIEQAPPDIDQYIHPSDSALLLASLTSFSVSRFEVESPASGDPRSVAIRFEFKDNEYFSDSVLEKKFWFRQAKDGWSGLVSEPVPIRWKPGKDQTEGLLDLVVKAWEAERKQSRASNGDSEAVEAELSTQQNLLRDKIESTGMGGISFFAWFGFIGRKVSAEESQGVAIKDEEERKARKAAKLSKEKSSPVVPKDTEDEDAEDELALEIFPDGDELAIAFSEDLWPNAIKYFTQAQEQDDLSDAGFEEIDVEELANLVQEDSDGDEEEEDARPAKKRKN